MAEIIDGGGREKYENEVLKAKVATLEQQLAQAQAACAEWRNGWETGFARVQANFYHVPEALRSVDWIWIALTKAIQSDCGKGWLSPDESAKLQAQCAVMREFIIGAQHAWAKGAAWSISADEIAQALSTTAGKDFLQKMERYEKALQYYAPNNEFGSTAREALKGAQ